MYQFFLNLPFGETMAEQTSISYYQTEFKFNGKELDSETGMYYYGARYYDPSLSIWMSVDPLAEQFPNFSPYNYTMNNPINMVDPDGRAPESKNDWVYKDGRYSWDEDVTSANDNDLNGREYVGKTKSDIYDHYDEKFDWWDKSTFGKASNVDNMIDFKSYGQAKVTKAVQRAFNFYSWYEKKEALGSNQATNFGGQLNATFFEDVDMRIQGGSYEGTLVLDGNEYQYTVTVHQNRIDQGVNQFGIMREEWLTTNTLQLGAGAILQGDYFYLTKPTYLWNKRTSTKSEPTFAIKFSPSDFESVVNWYNTNSN
ncbi:hypothetical protein BBFL7_02574 [Flavobacteria bacterium BBFL7]|nr:hypothetical protein BBFL7_02574 [Flavobacteria bacterium BBFL7]